MPLVPVNLRLLVQGIMWLNRYVRHGLCHERLPITPLLMHQILPHLIVELLRMLLRSLLLTFNWVV